MTKRQWSAMLFLLILGLITTGCQSSQTQEQTEPLRYGGQYYPEEFLLAGKPDFWEMYDLNVEHLLFSSGNEGNQALIAGEVDVNVGSDSKTVALFNAMPDEMLIIATVQRGDRYSTMVPVDSTYESWEDLKGQPVGVRLGTGAEQVLLRYFEETDGLDWNDFEWVDLNVEDMTAALENGSIQAFTAWEPTPAIAEAQGVGRVMRSYGDIALVPVSLHTTVSYAESHRTELVRFLAAHIAKVELIESDPEQAAQIASEAASAQGSEASPETFLKVFERVDFSLDVDENVIAALQDTAQFLYDQGKIESIPEFRYDTSFLEEAYELYNAE
ncbi:MAG: ABC transporter substrate-binding protein [Anaerolineae bacterium]|nr:ABC transporter substrate-binding protein [Anaerolineae bacterium]